MEYLNINIVMKNNKLIEQLFRENYMKLYHHAYSFLNDSETAKDIVNDAFEQLFIHYPNQIQSTTVIPLLYRLVRNLCIDLLRHQKVQNKFLLDSVNVEYSYVDEYYSHYDEVMQQIHKIILRLPSQTKVIFMKCFIEGKKYQEVADELSISINTVKTHIKKALRILREKKSYIDICMIIMIKQTLTQDEN